MILHIATFRWNDDVTDADVEALTAALMEMAAGIPELKSYTAGANLHLRPAGVDYGVVALVDDAAGLEAYLDSPSHVAVAEQYLSRMVAVRSAVQLPIAAGSFS